MAQTKADLRMLPISSRVRSVAVGIVGEFTGTIVGHMGSAYHVQDSRGQSWHRNASELTVIKAGR